MGGTTDGRRLAVVYSHIGPSSGAPFLNLVVYEAGVRRFVLHLSTFKPEAVRPEDVENELKSGEEFLLATYASELRDAGIAIGEYLPTPLAWCSVGDHIYIEPPETREWFFSVVNETCPSDDRGNTPSAQLFRLCPTGTIDETNCLLSTHDPDWDCNQGQDTSLLDVFSNGSVVWGVGRRHMIVLGVLEFNGLSMGGIHRSDHP